MSMLRIPKIRDLGSTWERVRSHLVPRERRGLGARKPRRLAVDPLEERTLLSVSPLDLDALLVNQTFGAVQSAVAGKSVAVDGNGDFAVTWTRYDTARDAAGAIIIDSATQHPLTEANVYARYFTDEVQRLGLPNQIAVDHDDNALTVGRFSLKYNAQVIQKISVTAGTDPQNDPAPVANALITGPIKLWFDANGDGVKDGNEEFTVNFDESDPAANALAIQTGLRTILPGAAGDSSHAIVQATSPHDYLVDFGAETQGMSQPQLVANIVDPVDATLVTLTGFMPAVAVSTIQRPFTINNIPVSPTAISDTIAAIEQYMQNPQTAFSTIVAPFDFQPQDRIGDNEAPYTAPVPSQVTAGVPAPVQGYDPTLQVRSVDGSTTTFDITFTGVSGKRIHPLFEVVAATDDEGNALDPTQASVKLMQQSSPEFRVNPPEADNPFTPGPDLYNQTQAVVAMDSDGEFVIAWRSEVPTIINQGSVSDIYARRFTPVGVTDSYNPGEFVPGQIVSQDVQRLTFTATGALPMVGTFKLRLANATSPDIAFDSTNLTATAADMQAKLIGMGYMGVTVSVVLHCRALPVRRDFCRPQRLGEPTHDPVCFQHGSAGGHV